MARPKKDLNENQALEQELAQDEAQPAKAKATGKETVNRPYEEWEVKKNAHTGEFDKIRKIKDVSIEPEMADRLNYRNTTIQYYAK